MAERTLKSFEEFWPYYLREHASARTRALHYVGTVIVIAAFLALLATGNLWWALAMPLAGYGFAWVAPFFVEPHRPAGWRAVRPPGKRGGARAMPLAGYCFAWFAHFFVERNRPATFTYPLWSLVSDFKMFFLSITGRRSPHPRAPGAVT